MKREIRVIGIDDSAFKKVRGKEVLVIGTIYRGGQFMDGIISTKIRKDGNNSTKKLIDMINNSKFSKQAQAIFLDGIALGGFNIVDINRLSYKTNLPVITIIRKKPDINEIKKILKQIGMERKIRIIEKFQKTIKHKKIYFQAVNIDADKTKHLIDICTKNADIPECIRIAHIIGQGVVLGQSRGRA